MGKLADRGLPGRELPEELWELFGDAYFCTERMGIRRDWSDGSHALTCRACGAEVREALDSSTGETVVLRRTGDRWMEWQGAPALSDLITGKRGHTRGDAVARSEGRVRDGEIEPDITDGLRDKVREQV